MTTISVIPADIVLQTAPQLFGQMFNWGLWGILTVQVYIFYLFFNEENVRIKCLVYTLYVLECAQLALSSANIFFWFARDWGQLTPLMIKPYLSPIDMPMMTGIVSMVVQLYFVWRIWILSSSLPICILIAAVSVTQGIAGIVAGAQALRLGDLTKYGPLWSPKIWLVGAAISDTMIAATMCFLLYRARERSMVHRTKYLLKRIIAITIETNVATATVAIITIVLWLTFKTNKLFLCPPAAASKLYTNTLLVIFNNRIQLPRDAEKLGTGHVTFGESTGRNNRTYATMQSDATTTQTASGIHNPGIEVNITRQVENDGDVDIESQFQSSPRPSFSILDPNPAIKVEPETASTTRPSSPSSDLNHQPQR